MNQLTIDINGKTVGFRFGVWVIGQLIKNEGLDLKEMQAQISANPIEFYVNIMYYGALWYCKKNKTEPDFEKEDVYDWIDELGGLGSKELQRLQMVFGESMTGDIPKKKATNPKKGTEVA